MSNMFLMRTRRLLFGVAFSFVLVTCMVNISLTEEEEELVVRLSLESKKREAILRWKKIDAATDYRAERSDDTSFKLRAATSGWITDTTYVFHNLEYDHTYYYRVGARVAHDTIWSETEQSYHSKPRGVRGFIDAALYGFLRFMSRGGTLMWIILFVLLVGSAVALKRVWALRLKFIFPYNQQFYSICKHHSTHKVLCETIFKDKQIRPNFLSRTVGIANREMKRQKCFNMFIEAVRDYWKNTEIENAKNLCEEFEDYPISRIFKFGLDKHGTKGSSVSRDIERRVIEIERAVERAIESVAANEREKLRKGHNLLWALASLAPMLGLLGTVIGISRSFHELGIHPELSFDEKLPLLADGIYQALFTTVLGLITAIPLLGIYYYLRDKVDWIYTQWEGDTLLRNADNK